MPFFPLLSPYKTRAGHIWLIPSVPLYGETDWPCYTKIFQSLKIFLPALMSIYDVWNNSKTPLGYPKIAQCSLMHCIRCPYRGKIGQLVSILGMQPITSLWSIQFLLFSKLFLPFGIYLVHSFMIAVPHLCKNNFYI